MLAITVFCAWHFVSLYTCDHTLSLEKPVGPGSPSRAQVRMDWTLVNTEYKMHVPTRNPLQLARVALLSLISGVH